MAKKVTQQDIARELGLSITTVNFVLKGRAAEKQISQVVVAKVFETARRMGYPVNYHNVALSEGYSGNLGLVSPRPARHMPYTQEVMRGIEERAHEQEYDLFIYGKPQSPGEYRDMRGKLTEHKIDALIVFSGPEASKPWDRLDAWPIVYVYPRRMKDYPTVYIDEKPGIEEAVKHLKELGHTHVMWFDSGVQNTKVNRTVERRKKTYDRLCKKYSIKMQDIVLTEQKLPIGELETLQVFRQSFRSILPECISRSTAFLCLNDLMAAAAAEEVRQLGLHIPRELSIVGFDDVYAVSHMPPMTSISMNQYETGRAATDLALDIVRKKRPFPIEERVAIQSKLTIRETTAPPRRSL